MMDFSDLLRNFGVSEQVVAEIRKEEAVARVVRDEIQEESPTETEAPIPFRERAYQAVKGWLLTTNPMSLISGLQDPPFDFAVGGENGKELFDIRPITSSSRASQHIDGILSYARSNAVTLQRKIAVVFVAESFDILTKALREIAKSYQQPTPYLKVVVGMIHGRIFEEYRRIGPQENIP
jgi:hypothetical protein